MSPSGFQQCPYLGVGLGLRSELFAETLACPDIDWLEIIPENFMGKGGSALEILDQAAQAFPLVSHGVNLSLGSVDPWDETYLNQLAELLERIQAPWFSDHLCFGHIDGRYFNDLMPLLRTRESVDHLVNRIRFIQSRFGRPFLIENISHYWEIPAHALSEADFLAEILEHSDCGLLLDINNIYVNALNHGTDPVTFLSRLPLERVVQIHIAGHHRYPHGVVDTHGSSVCEEVWQLLDYVLTQCRPRGIMLERDQYFPDFSEIRQELQQIRTIWERSQASTTAPTAMRRAV